MSWGNAVMQRQYQRPVGNEEPDMSSAENSLTEPEERPGTGSFRKITTLGRTESIAKELNECFCAIVINSRRDEEQLDTQLLRRCAMPSYRLQAGNFCNFISPRR